MKPEVTAQQNVLRADAPRLEPLRLFRVVESRRCACDDAALAYAIGLAGFRCKA
jgi:hypothetical protein